MNGHRLLESRGASVVSWLLLTLALAYFAARVPWRRDGEPAWDFAVCASSSYEWLHGRDAYDDARVMQSWIDRGADPSFAERSQKLRAIVPPPTLVALAPFAALPERVGTILFSWTSFLLVALGTWRCGVWAGLSAGTRWRVLFAGVIANAPLAMGLLSGNPALLSIPLCLIGLERAANRSPIVGALALGIGTALKVQIGGPFIVMAIVAGNVWPAIGAAVVLGAMLLIGIARSSIAGLDAWHAWLRNVADTNVVGGLNDYARPANVIDLLNLQCPLWQLTASRTVADVVAFAIAGALGLFAASLIWHRRKQFDAPLLAACIAGPLLLLPIYHRTYDGLVLIPVLAMLLSTRVRPALAIAGLLMLSTMLAPPNTAYRVASLVRLSSDSIVFRAMLAPNKAWAVLGLAIVTLAAARSLGRRPSATSADREAP